MKQTNINKEVETIETSVEPLSNKQELRKNIMSKKHRLGMLEEFKYSRETGVVLRENMTQIYTVMMNAQREDVEHRLMLEVDLIKKKGFVIYQDQVNELNKLIIDKSEQISEQITEMLQHGTKAIYERKKSWMEQISHMKEEGLLDEKSTKHEEERMYRWIGQRLESIDNKSELFFRSLEKTLSKTIKLLKQKVA